MVRMGDSADKEVVYFMATSSLQSCGMVSGHLHNSLEKVKTCPIEVVLLGGKGPMKGIVMK